MGRSLFATGSHLATKKINFRFLSTLVYGKKTIKSNIVMKKNLRSKMTNNSGFFPAELIASIVFMLVLFCSFTVSGQSVKEMGALLEEMKQSAEAEVQAEAAKLGSLSDDLNSRVYVNGGEVKAFGGNPVCAVVEGSSISAIYTENSFYNSVELIIIKIDKPGLAPINLSALQNFPNLKYIKLRCAFPVTASQVESMVTGSNDAIIVCYLVSIPG
jgi:hypothetical protein